MRDQMRWAGLVLVALLGIGGNARASVLWTQDFSNVSNWVVVYNPSGGITDIQSDGTQGLFSLQSSNSVAAFGPNIALTPFAAFVPANKANYAFDFITSSLTGSASYDLSLDEFDINSNYLGSVFGVFPQGTFTGPTNIALGAFSYDPSTDFLLPKITLYTGDGDQTVGFGKMEFTTVPEPATVFLVMVGMGLLGLKSIRKSAGSRR